MMAFAPLITFKAGQCESDSQSSNSCKVQPQARKGYLYLYSEDDLVHFCWRGREDAPQEPELDLVMVPTDGTFEPYKSDRPGSKTNGRVFVLKFASSSQRYFFWMQSKSQAKNGDPSWFSPRDRKIGDIVHRLLQGEEVRVTQELSSVRNVDDRDDGDDDDDDDDEQMEDAGQSGSGGRHGSVSGGAGADATGGDVREEGEGSRGGGADGARAASGNVDAADAVQRFMESMRGHPALSGASNQRQQSHDVPYPYLNHLLPTSVTIPMIDKASVDAMDELLGLLPYSVTVLASGVEPDSRHEPSAEAFNTARASLSDGNKRNLLRKVLRSPQFSQGLAGLTMALRDGGLPSIADALGVRVENAGYLQGGTIPVGGGSAVKTFVDGVKKHVQEKKP